MSALTVLAIILFLPIMLGVALGYCMVRLFLWAWPSLWQLLRPEGRAEYRATYDLIMDNNSSHLPWRARFYAFRELRYFH